MAMLAAVLCVVGVSPAGARAPASLVEARGAVELRRGGDATAEAVASVPRPLSGGDEVGTLADGRAAVRFEDGSTVVLEPGTSFTLAGKAPRESVVALARGRVRCLVTPDKERVFAVRTPVAVVAVRGTDFTVEARGPRETDVEVRSGVVAVQVLRDGAPFGTEALLEAGERLRVVDGEAGEPEAVEGRVPGTSGSGATAAALAPEIRREIGLQLGWDAVLPAAGGVVGGASTEAASAGSAAGGENISAPAPSAAPLKTPTLPKLP